MMPAKIEGESRPIGKPKGWDQAKDGHCATLHVRDQQIGGLAFMISAWEAGPLEPGYLLAGANVHLGISAPIHPVVNMGVGPVPEDFEPVYTIKPVPHPDAKKVIRVMRFSPKGPIYADAFVGGAGIADAFGKAVAAIEEYAAANGLA